ncbi:MAG: protein kinase, partial [Kangiellaceae bacterium]|nr:protein kinase [Kangiellaceae bacterium]
MSAIEIPGYKIVKTLGVGGQATVYLAIQKGFDREVALKVMSPALAADPTFGERFIREAKIVAKLSHKSIVTVYDVGESGNFYYLAMEYLRGGDLKSKIAAGMKARESLQIIATVAKALHFAHEKGYIHRDVKSENILFNDDGEPLLTDFGIAKASNSSTQMTQTGKLIGTPEYMSPEQCRGKTVDGRSDLYSLGIILYEMFTKGVPYTGEDSVAVCIKHVTKPLPQLSARLKHFQWLLDLLLAKDPQKRFQTGEELAASILEFKQTGRQGEATRVFESVKKIKERPEETQKQKETEEHMDAFDDLHSDHRQFLQEEEKSGVSGIVSLILVVLIGVGGFFTKERWLPQVTTWYQDISGKGKETTQQTADIPLPKQTNTQPQQIDSLPEKDSGTPTVEELLQQADSLVQFLPQKVEDIKQALKLIATVNTIDANNKNAQLIYQNILSASLTEATTLAESNRFDEAEQWVQLVEFEKPDYALLGATREKIDSLKLEYESKENEMAQTRKQLNEWLSNASVAVSENRLSSPAKDNAIFWYDKVLGLEPDNQSAIEGKQNVAQKYSQLIEVAIKQNTFSKARSMLERFNGLSDDESRKVALRQKIAAAEKTYKEQQKERQRLAAIAEQKKREEEARQEKLADPLIQMQLNGMLSSAQLLEQQGLLSLPVANNALEKYRAMLEIDDRNDDAKQGIQRIEQTIIEGLTEQVSAARKSQASEWLEQLKAFDPQHQQLASFAQAVEDIIEVEPQIEANNGILLDEGQGGIEQDSLSQEAEGSDSENPIDTSIVTEAEQQANDKQSDAKPETTSPENTEEDKLEEQGAEKDQTTEEKKKE